jgi:hypothetical protein
MNSGGAIGVISNPSSGHNREQFNSIQSRIDGCPDVHHIVTQSPADIAPALATLAQRRIDVLAINGGDGTASAVLGKLLESQLFQTPPVIVLLPGGTANNTAGDIGVPGPLKRAVERFCQWCEGERSTAGKLSQRALLQVQIGAQKSTSYGMFMGGGAVIHGTEYAHQEVHSRGLRDDFSLALSTLRTVWGVLRDDPRFNRHIPIELSLDGQKAKAYDTLILAVSTLERLSFGMRPFWGGGPGDIRLTLMEQNCTQFARTFLSIARGRPSRNAIPASGYYSHNASKVRLTMTGKLNLDGEILEVNGDADISASAPLQFLIP